MSKILFSVFCVVLALISLFTFVRSAFGVAPLTAREFVESVSDVSFDFKSTKSAIIKARGLFNNLEIPTYEGVSIESLETSDPLFDYGWQFELPRSECQVLDDGSVIAPNGVRYTNWEVSFIYSEKIVISLYTSPRIWKAALAELTSESEFLSSIAKDLIYVGEVLGFICNAIVFVFSILDCILAAVIDTVIFVLDCIWMILYFLGIENTSTISATI